VIACQAASAISTVVSYEKMVALAITDEVTGLYTHRYFQARLTDICKDHERTHTPFSLIMIDIDQFRRCNDSLGHSEGDRVLKEVAILIQSYTPESDLVCRKHSDKFFVILRESDRENSRKMAERFREAIRLAFQNQRIRLTASIGVADFPGDGTSASDVIAAAETSLNRAKRSGGNQVSTRTQR
jgi:diguanylate cyclase (GGDEF)-like protein